MSRVVLSGYYGFGNAGDEAVLYSIIKALRQEDPLLELIVLSGDPAQTVLDYRVEAVNRWRPDVVCRELWRADLIISGGGSLLQDVTGLKSIIYYLGICWLAKRLGKPVMFYAQGIGPVRSRLGQSLVRLIGNQVDLVTVRDTDSSLLLTSLGVKCPAIRVTADPVFGLNCDDVNQQAGRDLLTRAGVELEATGRPLVGISVRAWPGWVQSRAVLAQAADTLVRKGWDVIWIPFHFPVDVDAGEAVASFMQEKSYVVRISASTEELLGLIGHLQLLIGMRLHALIMAALVGVPCIGISYDPKIDSFLKLVEMPCAGQIGTLTLPVLTGLIEQLEPEARQPGFPRAQNKVQTLSDLARENARLALQLISKQISS